MKKILIFLICYILIFPVPVCAEQEAKKEEAGLQSEHYYLMEANSGKVIAAKNEDERLSPASITKIMTTLLIFEAIDQKKITMEDMVTTSAYAKSMGGSQVFLEEGEQQSVETMIKCIIIASGNDASVAMAEKIAGSEEAFVEMMNQKAAKLGMNNTHFEDCCGLTDSDNHYSSAKDVAIMSRELITRYPKILEYSSIWMETIIHKTNKGESEFVLSNTNKLLKANEYVKGLKTGSTSKAKYCVSNVAIKDGVTLISVVMAAPDYKVRFSDSGKLINMGFAKCKTYTDDEEQMKLDTIGGEKNQVRVKKEKLIYVDTDGIDFSKIQKKNQVDRYLETPIKKGDVVGTTEYYLGGKKIAQSNIVAEESVAPVSYGFEVKRLFSLFFQFA